MSVAGPVIPVWLDCDPGHDDALAIILCGHSPGLKLLGISTVAGNQSLPKVTQNALDICWAAGLPDTLVVAGQAAPLLRAGLKACPEIHGESGLDGPQGSVILPRSPRSAVAGPAVVVMAEHIRAAWHRLHHAPCQPMGSSGEAATPGGGPGPAPPPTRVRLVCTGSLTNAALLLAVYPELLQQVEVVIMGGSMGTGNTGPMQEFNIQQDPEAARMVFSSGVPLTMVPLDVTHTCLVEPAVLARIRSQPLSSGEAVQPPSPMPPLVNGEATTVASTPFRRALEQLLLFFQDTYRTVFGFSHPPLHDPCAVAFVLAPHLFTVRHLRVDIETVSPHTAGQTVCDVWGQTGLPPNCGVATKVQVGGFWELMLAAVDAADAVSPLNQT